ncbi:MULTISPECIES: LysE/ArgO family amino acid transporter [Arthrobacter]|uniref:LysE/ArgO family amino acid transporter n=2 Tax=Arthrobacter TaxID=1663 RepID=A0ABU9KGF8_9MICC|nr:LysE/ArgO family amino acid transporter [Arthrobacter sp. YJM1]MDP5225969.1 LysE/ArgO family amino acid transporter [Arthrobacter sp. YJM1]
MILSVLPIFLAGLGAGLSLIIAIGAQNAFVLRQGLAREHVAPVVLLCMASDAVLILAGISGIGVAINAAPWILQVAKWAGAAFLLVYAFMAARRVMSKDALVSAEGSSGAGLWATLATVAALTWLNPHVYLDTVLLLGSLGAAHGDGRWAFGAGAALGSVLWFSLLGFGARFLAPVFARPWAWRLLDGAIAVTMVLIAAQLVLST